VLLSRVSPVAGGAPLQRLSPVLVQCCYNVSVLLVYSQSSANTVDICCEYSVSTVSLLQQLLPGGGGYNGDNGDGYWDTY
jgi:hypothetical protein